MMLLRIFLFAFEEKTTNSIYEPRFDVSRFDRKPSTAFETLPLQVNYFFVITWIYG